jgi:hypothetical protein
MLAQRKYLLVVFYAMNNFQVIDDLTKMKWKIDKIWID